MDEADDDDDGDDGDTELGFMGACCGCVEAVSKSSFIDDILLFVKEKLKHI